MATDATYESVGPSESIYERKRSSSVDKSASSVDAPPLPPLPPPLPAPLPHAHMMRNPHRDSNDSLADSIDNNQVDEMMESDSGFEVIEEPTLRPSELVRGNNNRSMSIISGEEDDLFKINAIINFHYNGASKIMKVTVHRGIVHYIKFIYIV